MSTEQNVINSLQRQRHDLMLKLNALQAQAQRLAFESVVNGSWKAQEQFRCVASMADEIGDEIGMLDLALAEAYERLQSRGRDVRDVMRELKFSEATK